MVEGGSFSSFSFLQGFELTHAHTAQIPSQLSKQPGMFKVVLSFMVSLQTLWWKQDTGPVLKPE